MSLLQTGSTSNDSWKALIFCLTNYELMGIKVFWLCSNISICCGPSLFMQQQSKGRIRCYLPITGLNNQTKGQGYKNEEKEFKAQVSLLLGLERVRKL